MSGREDQEIILEVRGLKTYFRSGKELVPAVDGVDFTLRRGETLGIVGESGCGKSITSMSIMHLLPPKALIVGGSVSFKGKDITHAGEKEMAGIRGKEMAMIFQEPMTSLNPVVKVGRQVDEAVRLHTNCTRAEAKQKTLNIFREVEIPEPEARYDCYPHQLSGGLRQRVMIAMAMVCRPKLLIADEPTTALDVTVEAQILKLLEKLRDGGTSVLIISHNLGVIARVCDLVYVMYAGRIVEHAETEALFARPLHPYTQGLFSAVSSLRAGGETLKTIPGVVPNLLRLPKGCSFSLRCGRCGGDCENNVPELREMEPGHAVRCFLAEKEDRE